MQAMALTLTQLQAALSSLSAKSPKSLEASVGAISIIDTPAAPEDNMTQVIKQGNASLLKLHQGILKKQKADKS